MPPRAVVSHGVRAGCVAACLLACLAGWCCTPSDPIRIGFVGGTSGRVADLGITGRDAVQQAIEECNRSGGIHGRPLQLIVRDDTQDLHTATQVVRELIAEGVHAIVGPMTSAMGVVMAPIASESRVVMVSPTVTSEALSGIDDYFFRVTSTTREFAAASAAYQLTAKHLRRMAAVFDQGNAAFSENWLKNFSESFERGGGAMIAALGFTSGDEIVFSDLARRLLALRPDGVLIVANSMDSALLCQQIRKLDGALAIALSDWGATERLLEMGGKAVEGVSVVQTFDRDSPQPAYQVFRRAFRERYHREPGFAGVYAYDATRVVCEALARQGRGQSLKQAILAVRQFDGLQSVFRFDDFGDVKRPHISMAVVRQGQFVVTGDD